MALKLAKPIREARESLKLTQEQLARRLGLKGRSVYRWESGTSVPTKRHQRALVTAVQAVNPKVAAKLAAAMKAPAAKPTPAPSPQLTPAAAFELAIFTMADELDLPPRRVRGPLLRLLRRTRAAGFSTDTLVQGLEAWIARVE